MNSMHFHFLCLVLTLNIELLGGGRMAFFAFFTGGGDTQRRVGPCPLPFVAMPPFDEPPRATCRFYDAFLVYRTIRAVKRRLRWGGVLFFGDGGDATPCDVHAPAVRRSVAAAARWTLPFVAMPPFDEPPREMSVL